MFLPPPAPSSRPLFALSAAAHAALVVALVVPTLLATPEPPEPDGTVRIDWIPVVAIDVPAGEKDNLLGKGIQGGGATAPVARANGAAPRPALTQPPTLTDAVLPPSGEEPELPIEESGERSEPGWSGSPRGGGFNGGDTPGCEGCEPIAASGLGVTLPVAIETPAPSYPELARRAHKEGVVVLRAVIGIDGSVGDVKVVQSVSPLLDPAAVEAVRRWRYRPARLGERTVAVYLDVVVTFSLRNI